MKTGTSPEDNKRFSRAIVCPPCANFAEGLSASQLGPPSYERALKQHEQYCLALEVCGLVLTRLEADRRYPDSTFVEDTAVLTKAGAILCRPGAPSRLGETERMRATLQSQFGRFRAIEGPGTVDGGDVCEAGRCFFIGVSGRTNEEGASQLAGFLKTEGYAAELIDIRGNPALLHLKSGMAYLGDGRLLIVAALAKERAFSGYEAFLVPEGEEYAANCVRVNEEVLVASGYPRTERLLRTAGYSVASLDVSEFRKMDGGLSCLSLRI